MRKSRNRVTGDTSKSALARALGMTRPMLYKYAVRGMPMDSEKSARAWLQHNSTGKHGPEASSNHVKGVTRVTGDTPGDTSASDLKGLSLGDLTKRLMIARIKLTERDTALRALQERQDGMDADLRDGKLLLAEERNRRDFERAVTLRNKLMELSNAWALQLAAITDPALVADFTRKRIKAALIEYCVAHGVGSEEEARADYPNLDLKF